MRSLSGSVFIVFLVMKLGGWGPVASWSWWWVTSPLWFGMALALGVTGALFALEGRGRK